MSGYGSDEDFNAWMADGGYTTTGASSLSVAQLRQRGADYIDGTYGARFYGEPTGGFEQERAWPRVNAKVHKAAVPSDLIPRSVIIASYFAALHEDNNPGALAVAARATGQVKRKKVDVLETEFFESSGDAAADATIKLSAVEGLLAPFLKSETTGVSFGLWAVG